MENLADIKQKWWGWGDPQKRYDLSDRPHFWPYMARHFCLPPHPILPIPSLEDFAIPETGLSSAQIENLIRIMDGLCSIEKMARLNHSTGKSYHDLIRLRYHRDISFPDAVVYPKTEEQISELFLWAKKQNVSIVPFGGGTSVVGGVDTIRKEPCSKTVVADLLNFNKVIAFHPDSLTIEAEAGIFGPDLEKSLNEKGFTLCHFPESFEYSTLGGWIATRSAGQLSTLYGKIEDMVSSVRMVSPNGVIETHKFPGTATGPEMKDAIIGSEGIFGIITKATMRIQPLPMVKWHKAYFMPDFETGVHLARQWITQGIRPSLLRLSDGTETDLALALVKWPSGKIAAGMANLYMKWIGYRGFAPSRRGLLLLGLEGDKTKVKMEKKRLEQIWSQFKSYSLGQAPARLWLRHRYDNPYLRDELIDYGFLVDTMETAIAWDGLLPLYQGVKTALYRAFKDLGIAGIVTAHLSHLYPQGSSLYFIVLAQPKPGEEIRQWAHIKMAASEAIVQNGGTISHHHGVGTEHKVWFKKQIPDMESDFLKNCKNFFDPAGILNPGKLIPDR